MERGLIILIIVVLVLILGVFVVFYNIDDNEDSSLNKIKEIFVSNFKFNQTLNNSKEPESVNDSEVSKSTKRRICADQIGSEYAAPLCPCWRIEEDECIEYDNFGVCGTDCSVSCGIFASKESCESALGKCGDGVCENYEKSMDFYYCSEDCGEEGICHKAGQSFDSSLYPESKCCEGLVEKSQYDLRNCVALPGTKFTCVDCGDGVCGDGENNCNCAEDCE